MEYFFGPFQVEDYLRAKEIIEKNQEEVNPLGWEFSLDITKYTDGTMWTGVLYDGDTLVGYGVYSIVSHHHFKDKTLAVQDAVFVHPDYRKGITGIKFLNQLDMSLRDMNVDGIIKSTTTERDLSKLYERQGYKPIEQIFFKEL